MTKLHSWLKKYFIPHAGNEYRPHFLRHESMWVFFFVIMAVEIGFLVQVFVVFDNTKFLASVLPGVLTTITNEERAQNDAPPLVENTLLDKAAQAKAEDMATKGYFAHTSPEGKTPWYWFDKVGYRYTYAGENLAVNFFESNDIAEAWMNSPTHRANIVKKDYTEIGIGVASGMYQGRSTVFVAELFGTPLAFATSKESPVVPPTKLDTKTITSPKVTPPKSTVPVVTTSPVQVVTPPVVATNPTPTAVKVLGEESTSLVATGNAIKQSPLKSFIHNALSSPRQSVNYVYEIIGLLIILALIILLVKSEIHHPAVIARGFAMIAVIIILSIMNLNLRAFNHKTEVPLDNHNFTASAIQALP